MPELRKDPVLGRWVITGTERVRSPTDLYRQRLPRRAGPCVLCPGREHETPPELLAYRDGPTLAPDTPGWRVRVVPDKFPVLRTVGDVERRGRGIYDLMNGVGVHEIVIESPDHRGALGSSTTPAVEDVVRAYRDRILEIKRDGRMRAVVIFKAHGVAVPGSMDHPHSQLLATPIVPMALAEELQQTRAYYDYRERCLFCDIVQQEIEEGSRVVAATEDMIAFAPFAARAPFETWIVPRRHAAAFESAWAGEQHGLAAVLQTVLARLDGVLGDPPFTLRLHSAPFAECESPSFHWHIEIVPQLLPGSALDAASGFHVNPMPPEDAARYLREA